MSLKPVCYLILLSLLPGVARGQDPGSSGRPPDLVASSDLAVVGTVTAAQGQWDGDRRVILTRVAIRVDRALGHEPPPAQVVLDQAGGRVGDTAMAISHLRQPDLAVGDRVLLLLVRTGEALYARGLARGEREVESLHLVSGKFLPEDQQSLRCAFPGLQIAFESPADDLRALFKLEPEGEVIFDEYIELLTDPAEESQS